MQIPEISPAELAQKLSRPEAERPLLLDVRTPGEHRLVALPGSVLIPLQDLPRRARELEGARGREIVVYCHTGMRSLTGAAFLIRMGLDARSLASGIDGYSVKVDPSLPRY